MTRLSHTDMKQIFIDIFCTAKPKSNANAQKQKNKSLLRSFVTNLVFTVVKYVESTIENTTALHLNIFHDNSDIFISALVVKLILFMRFGVHFFVKRFD